MLVGKIIRTTYTVFDENLTEFLTYCTCIN